jgi:3,4-dihydroxy 2-butanone 4-phosphate synthase/GTP cyclohydrolase II
VVVLDDENRENEGDLVFAAEMATTALVAFTVRHTSGYLCVALPEDRCDKLHLIPMYPTSGDPFGTAFAVTVDAAEGVSTGISARDRAHTIRLLADPDATHRHFTRPGHMVPLRARPGGVLRRPGHTEAAVDLARLAGMQPVGALCGIVSARDGRAMAHGQELRKFASEHSLTLISVGDLIAYRRRFDTQPDAVRCGCWAGMAG